MGNSKVDRRTVMLGAGAIALTSCATSIPNYDTLDEHSSTTADAVFKQYPPAQQTAEKAAGYLVFPQVTKGGIIVGGMRGDGTLFSQGNIIGHYALAAGTVGFQAGIQRFSMILFFMTPEAMAKFRSSSGAEIGTDIEYALPSRGGISVGTSSATLNKPVYALIFNQDGIMLGASLKGALYTPI